MEVSINGYQINAINAVKDRANLEEIISFINPDLYIASVADSVTLYSDCVCNRITVKYRGCARPAESWTVMKRWSERATLELRDMHGREMTR